MEALFNQLALMSTSLGGFSLVFLGAIMTISTPNLRVKPLIISASTSASCAFIISGIGWGMLQFYSSSPENVLSPADKIVFVSKQHTFLSNAFAVGILALFVCLASSGFLASKYTGITTLVITTMAFALLALTFIPYITLH